MPVGMLVVFLSSFVSPWTNTTFEVAAGETFTVTKGNEFIVTRFWKMGDGSTLNFAPDVTTFTIVAEEASFGNDVTIDGSGIPGAIGQSGVSATTRSGAGDCRYGHAGTSAANGKDGGDGVVLQFTIGISELGSVMIMADGGAGGNGGNGGNGMSGSKGDCSQTCNGGSGGGGGNGGHGGNGGNGGAVRLEYKFLDTGLDIGRINIRSSAGGMGQGGKAGIGGQGGRGRTCPWPAPNRSGGGDGSSGSAGVNGSMGHEGDIQTLRRED